MAEEDDPVYFLAYGDAERPEPQGLLARMIHTICEFYARLGGSYSRQG